LGGSGGIFENDEAFIQMNEARHHASGQVQRGTHKVDA
jgi:hypothetical protein